VAHVIPEHCSRAPVLTRSLRAFFYQLPLSEAKECEMAITGQADLEGLALLELAKNKLTRRGRES